MHYSIIQKNMYEYNFAENYSTNLFLLNWHVFLASACQKTLLIQSKELFRYRDPFDSCHLRLESLKMTHPSTVYIYIYIYFNKIPIEHILFWSWTLSISSKKREKCHIYFSWAKQKSREYFAITMRTRIQILPVCKKIVKKKFKFTPMFSF